MTLSERLFNAEKYSAQIMERFKQQGVDTVSVSFELSDSFTCWSVISCEKLFRPQKGNLKVFTLQIKQTVYSNVVDDFYFSVLDHLIDDREEAIQIEL